MAIPLRIVEVGFCFGCPRRRAYSSVVVDFIWKVAALKQQQELKEKEFESRLRNVEQMNQKSVNELRDMLSRQQRVGAEWVQKCLL